MRSINPPKRAENWTLNAALALLMLVLLMAGCAAPQPLMQPPPVKAVQLPPLAPPPPKPSICLPDCLTAWQSEQQHLLNMLMPQPTTPAIAAMPMTAPAPQ